MNKSLRLLFFKAISAFRPIYLVSCLGLFSANVMALDQLNLQLGHIRAAGWQAKNINIQLNLPQKAQNHVGAHIRVKRLTLTGIKNPLHDLHLQCNAFYLTVSQLRCDDARLKTHRSLLPKTARFSFRYDLQTQATQLNITQFALAKGSLSGRINVNKKTWQVQFKFKKVDLSALYTVGARWMTLPKDYVFAGKLTGNAMLSSNNMQLNVNLQQGSFSDVKGLYAGDGLQANLAIEAKLQGSRWDIQQNLHLQKGELLADALYLAITDKPIRIKSRTRWHHPMLDIMTLDYQHQDVVQFNLNGSIAFAPQLQPNIELSLHQTQLNTFYQHYLKAYLDTTGLQDLRLGGTLHGRVNWRNNAQKISIFVEHINFYSKKQAIKMNELNGEVHWRGGSARPTASYLHWNGGHFLSYLRLGRGSIHAVVQDDTMYLLDTLRQKVLDGELSIQTFDISRLGKPDMTWKIRSQLKPISLSALSQALGLPPLQGKIAADVPSVHYHNKQLDIDGALLLHIFEGEVILKQLKLDNPFGKLPILTAAVDVKKINLQPLTEITGFGDIQGELSGSVRDLYLLNWQPVAFDAMFKTPKDNRLPRKISQQAVKSLYDVGGQGSAVNSLSKGVLGIFSAFSYQRLGWGCKLKNNLCIMRGVEPAASGYYIVKGGGLPRINVIGYNQQVDWKTLVTRLKRVTTLNLAKPVIK